MAGPLFWAAELDVFQASSAAPPSSPGLLARPRLALAPLPTLAEVSETVRASDLGYRTPGGDPDVPAGAVQVYPPRLASEFELDRTVQLGPEQAGVAVGWGTLRLANFDRALDRLVTLTTDARAVRLYAARKSFDLLRGIEIDPPRAALAAVAGGVGTGLELGDGVLEVAVRDAAFWIERSLQAATYAGTGGLQGGAGLKGRPLPRLRGGTAADPVRSITPVLVDEARRIYQFSDAPAHVVRVYEGGFAGVGGLAFAGDVADLTSGSVAGGYYRTNAANGLLQLGTDPTRPISLDAYGDFTGGGVASRPALVARRLLLDDLALPAGLVDSASFDTLDALCPWVAGRYWDGAAPVEAVAAVGEFLRSCGARLLPTRDGRLRAVPLRAPAAGELPAATWDAGTIADLRPSRLPANLLPAIYRARVAHSRIHTVQQEVGPSVTAAERARLGEEWQTATAAAATGTLAAFLRPADGPLVETALTAAASAEALAGVVAALWGVRRRLFSVTVPLEVGLRRDLGELVAVTYPAAGLAAGAVGRLVGEQLRGRDGTATFTVLF